MFISTFLINFWELEFLISLILNMSQLFGCCYWEIKKVKAKGEKQMALTLQAKPNQEGWSSAHANAPENSSGSKEGYRWKGEGGGEQESF